MKKYRLLILLLILFLPATIYGTYESERQDIYDYKEFFDDLYPIEENNSNTCSTVGTVYADCSGVTVNGTTLTLDEYVAGVIKGEFGGSASNDENRLNISKVNAIAARSFLMAQTGCTSVVSGPNFQVYRGIDPNDHYDQIYLKAAEETAGIVMMKNNKFVTGYFVTVPTSQYITKSNGNWTFHMLSDANDESTAYDYTMPESDIFRIASYTGGLIYPEEDTGHHWGIPTVGAAYEVEKGTSTEAILKMFYGNDISLAKLNSSGTSSSNSSSTSFACDDDTEGEYVSSDGITFKAKNYDINGNYEDLGSAFDLTVSNVSQCPWYAKYRAIEIVESSSLSSDLKEKAKSVLLATSGHGIDWYGGTNSTLSYFQYSSDINKAKPGSIINWSRQPEHEYGHVGIVEKVNSDGSLVISEGWNMGGINAADIPSNIRVITTTYTLDQVRNYNGRGSFVGYTYILSHKK